MFGSNDADTAQNTNDTPDESATDSLAGQTIPPTAPVAPQAGPVSDVQPGSGSDWQHPGTPLAPAEPPAPASSYISDVSGSGSGQPAVSPVTDRPSAPTIDTGTDGSPHELIDIKQQALGQLSPLLSHLDQAPEDKFRTLLMMIQASDDQNLVKSAYDAANAIQDEKARAQALLDIVNEINYFTQQHHQA